MTCLLFGGFCRTGVSTSRVFVLRRWVSSLTVLICFLVLMHYHSYLAFNFLFLPLRLIYYHRPFQSYYNHRIYFHYYYYSLLPPPSLVYILTFPSCFSVTCQLSNSDRNVITLSLPSAGYLCTFTTASSDKHDAISPGRSLYTVQYREQYASKQKFGDSIRHSS